MPKSKAEAGELKGDTMSAYATCATCRFWKIDLGRDGSVRTSNLSPNEAWHSMGVCSLTESSRGLPMHEGSLALAMDADEYGAVLRTAPNFGCIQHQGV